MARLPRSARLLLSILALLVGPGPLAAGTVGSAGGDALPAPTAIFAATGLPADEIRRLEAGETVVHMANADDDGAGPNEGTAWRLLEAPAERLYRAAADWPHYAEFFPFVVESTVEPLPVEGGARPILARQRIDLPFPFADRSFAARTSASAPGRGSDSESGSNPGSETAGRSPHEPAWRVAWRLLPGSGDVVENRGAWTFRPLAPGLTLVELHLATDLGDGVPLRMQRRALADTLPWALDGLRQQVRRCRYDLPVHPTCAEEPPWPAPPAGGGP